MSKHRTWHLVVMITGLVGCAGNGDMNTSSTEQPVAGTDTLFAGERLLPNEQISAGHTTLVYQGDNNLVLYQDGGYLWASFGAVGSTPEAFWMQNDCNAVVYNTSGATWASNTDGRGANCVAHVMEGDWYVCSGTTRVFDAHGGHGDCGPGARPSNYLGCYIDLLPAFRGNVSSYTACVNICGSQNFSLAGLEFGNECLCGNAPVTRPVGDAECDMPCAVNGGPCGGNQRTSVYRTGIVHL